VGAADNARWLFHQFLAYQKLSGHPALATTTIDIANDQTEWRLESVHLGGKISRAGFSLNNLVPRIRDRA